jgi:hypothetical protein
MSDRDSDSVSGSLAFVGTILPFNDDADRQRTIRELKAEAAALIEIDGHNIYSHFILSHGRRPDRDQAAVIGQILGKQVRASDGTLQPRRTKAEKEELRLAKRVQEQKYLIWDHIGRLRAALENLASNEADPRLVADKIANCDRPKIDATLRKSLDWLSRFAREWDGVDHGAQIADETSYLATRGVFRSEKIRRRADNDP